MWFRSAGIAILACSVLAVQVPAQAASLHDSGAPNFAGHLQTQLQRLERMPEPQTAGARLSHVALLQQAYRRTAYAPIWTTAQGWQPRARYLLEYLAEVHQHGISGQRYHLDTLQRLQRHPTLANRIHSDLLLSDAFIKLLQDLEPAAAAGRRHAASSIELLLRLDPEADPRRVLDARLPQDAEYWALSRALKQLLADDPPARTAPLAAALTPGDIDPAVFTLGLRLRALGDYAGPPSELFTPELADALRRFQRRHGLDADGVVGPATRDQLNAGRDARIHQLVSNLERRRRHRAPDGDSHIRVNVAAQHLRYVHDGRTALEMSVIVGRSSRPTPMTRGAINEVVLNPDWTVPFRIAVRDKLPVIQQDPDYLPTHGFTVQTGWAPDAAFVDPGSIDWHSLGADNFPYVLRQRPGANNALGRVKFLFPNDYSVYLHDTPNHALFERGQRLFSSGCVRLSRPMELAELLLRHHAPGSDWPALQQREETLSLALSEPVPVSLEYWTAWVDDQGALQFRPDVYGRDDRLLAELQAGGRLANPATLIAELQREDTLRVAEASPLTAIR